MAVDARKVDLSVEERERETPNLFIKAPSSPSSRLGKTITNVQATQVNMELDRCLNNWKG